MPWCDQPQRTPEVQSHLRVEEVDDGRWRLLEDFVYHSDVVGSIIVPAGFVTDFASVPRVPVAFWFVGDTAHLAAVVHDYLYSTGIFPKATADRVFLEAMAVTGIPHWRRWLMYLGVRWGGGLAWETYRRGLPQPKRTREA
jgi:hypothetical protein